VGLLRVLRGRKRIGQGFESRSTEGGSRIGGRSTGLEFGSRPLQ
jgi:hypothetical protein